MIVTFCGHADFSEHQRCRPILLSLLEQKIGKTPTDFYLGGYGAFDAFAYACCKEFQATHPQVKLIYVTPYLADRHLKTLSEQYDSILYLPIENAPPKYAISYRNREMIQRADWVVAYVTRNYGGAYQTYRFAQNLKKEIFNLIGDSNEHRQKQV